MFKSHALIISIFLNTGEFYYNKRITSIFSSSKYCQNFFLFPKQPFELGCRYIKICTAPSFDGYHWKKITITDIRHFSFCELFKNDDSLQPPKHRLVFPRHTVTHILSLLILGETGLPCDHWNVRGGKNHFPPQREKLNILRETLKIQRSDSLLDDTMITGMTFISVNGSFGYTDRWGCSQKFGLSSLICMYRAKTMAISFKRKSIKCKQLFYLVQIYACI